MAGDDVLDTLLLPLRSGEVALPESGAALFVRARAGTALNAMAGVQWHCQQSFKPFADTLVVAGHALVADDEARYPLVLALPPRQREEARATLARAFMRLTPGGLVLAAMANAEGARSMQADIERLAGSTNSVSKHKCRAVWAVHDASHFDAELCAQWLQADAPRMIADGRFTSRPGLFAWDRIDPGSALLAAHLPVDLSGCCADLGAGYGYLSVELLARCPQVTTLDLFEAEARALELAQINLARCEHPALRQFHWHDVTIGLPGRYDVIICNPPFHVGAASDAGLGLAFIASAAHALLPSGQLWLVANRHLPYEAGLAHHFRNVRSVAQAQGYKIIHASESIQ
jgi:16S rRNA (guanine1207-N2)-methyltransferase